MLQLYAQNEFDWRKQSLVFSPELQVGKTMKAYYGFPRTSLQKQIVFGIGRDHAYNPQDGLIVLTVLKQAFH